MDWIAENLNEVRSRRVLVHSITNLVVTNSTANGLLAIGAAPVMAHCTEEIEEIVTIADGVLVNIGTLDKSWIESMKKAIKAAGEKNKALVLDPVGAGASRLRTETSRDLAKMGVTVIKGNYSEMEALVGNGGKTRGVDSAAFDELRAAEVVKEAAREYKCVAAVTGKTDYVSDGKVTYAIDNGDEMLCRITGTGCMLGAITAGFCATGGALKGTASALAVFAIAGEMAAENTDGPGSFAVELFNQLYAISSEDIKKRAKVRLL